MLRIALCATLLLVCGCSTNWARQEAEQLFAHDEYERGIAVLEKSAKNHPRNASVLAALALRRAEATSELLTLALSARAQGREEEAAASLGRLLRIDPLNERGLALQRDFERDRRHREVLAQASDLARAGKPDLAAIALERALRENPNQPALLDLRNRIESEQRRKQDESMYRLVESRPISLEFRDAELKIILEAVARSAGVSFVFDKDVRSEALATIFLRQAALEDAVNFLAATNQLQAKVLNPTTVLIYPDTPEKNREYQDLLLKSFFLASVGAKDVAAQLKSVLKSRDMIVDERRNLIIMRDTPDAIRVAERVIGILDVSEPEVMLDVEVLEVNRGRLLELGARFPDQLTLSPLEPGGGDLTLKALREVSSATTGVTTPSLTLNLKRELGDVNILANPRIRAKSKERAKILIGDRIPVVSTTATSTGFVSENIQYVEVGIKLEVEPEVSVDDSVSIKVDMEVSSIAKELSTASGSIAYQIGTRNATTVLRLHDGETQILAGLISDEARSTANRIPIVGDLPLLGRLFGNTRDQSQKSEIVLSITPRIVRSLRRPDLSETEFWSGTEAQLRMRPLALPVAATSERKAEAALEQDASDGISQVVANNVQISWSAPPEPKAGETFRIALRVKSDGGLKALPLRIGFDPSMLEVLDVEEGNFFKRGNGATSFSHQVLAAEGKVLVGIMRNGSDAVEGEDTLVTLVARANKTGQTSLQIEGASALGLRGSGPVIELPPPVTVQAR